MNMKTMHPDEFILIINQYYIENSLIKFKFEIDKKVEIASQKTSDIFDCMLREAYT